MRSQVIYAKVQCRHAAVNPTFSTTTYAIDHAGGAAATSSTTPRATRCVDYQPRSEYATCVVVNPFGSS